MLDADRIVDLLTLAGVLAFVALPVAVLVIGVLVWINRRRDRAVKDWAARHGDLKRRLADVEALRKGDPAPSVGVEDAIGMVRSTAFDPHGVITITADLTPCGRYRLEELGIIPIHTAFYGVTSREQEVRRTTSMSGEHVGDPPYGRAECAETEGDCS